MANLRTLSLRNLNVYVVAVEQLNNVVQGSP